LSKSRRRYKFNFRKLNSSQKTNFLVIILTLIVLIETAFLLFLIPQKTSIRGTGRVLKKPVVQARKTPKIKEEKEVIIKITTIPKILPTKAKGKIAIVIDDWGYSNNNLDILREIRSPLTLAILPFRDYSRQVAEFGHKNNFEIIIHMPMEPENKENVNLEPKTLMINMSSRTVNSIMKEAFDDIVYAKGINNHMGSLATQDKDFMEKVFKVLKKKNLYFLDSYVIADSVADTVAKKIGIKFARRSVFLDNESDPKYIRNKLEELAKESELKGKAMGIGHERKGTLMILKEEIPKFIRDGYEFVYVSEIAE